MRVTGVLFAAWWLVLSGGCAAPARVVDAGPTPAEVVSSGDATAPVHWGGRILAVKNLRDRTLVEVIGLPLSGDGGPQPEGKPRGRFIVEQPGFLDPHEYAPQRLLEVQGRLNGFSTGQIGEAGYRYPVVTAKRLVLWPRDAAGYPSPGSPRINFGLGVDNYGGSIGIGIGF